MSITDALRGTKRKRDEVAIEEASDSSSESASKKSKPAATESEPDESPAEPNTPPDIASTTTEEETDHATRRECDEFLQDRVHVVPEPGSTRAYSIKTEVLALTWSDSFETYFKLIEKAVQSAIDQARPMFASRSGWAQARPVRQWRALLKEAGFENPHRSKFASLMTSGTSVTESIKIALKDQLEDWVRDEILGRATMGTDRPFTRMTEMSDAANDAMCLQALKSVGIDREKTCQALEKKAAKAKAKSINPDVVELRLLDRRGDYGTQIPFRRNLYLRQHFILNGLSPSRKEDVSNPPARPSFLSHATSISDEASSTEGETIDDSKPPGPVIHDHPLIVEDPEKVLKTSLRTIWTRLQDKRPRRTPVVLRKDPEEPTERQRLYMSIDDLKREEALIQEVQYEAELIRELSS